MYEFGKLAYFIIRFIVEFELDTAVGGLPQIWYIPNTGKLFTDKDRHQWMTEYEIHCNQIISNFRKYIITSLV
jgi:hypothetical protein